MCFRTGCVVPRVLLGLFAEDGLVVTSVVEDAEDDHRVMNDREGNHGAFLETDCA